MVPKFCCYGCLTKTSSKSRFFNGSKLSNLANGGEVPNAKENLTACMNNLFAINICINFNKYQHLDHDGHVERVREVIGTNQRRSRGITGSVGWKIQLNFWTVSASGGEGTCLRDTVPLLRGWTITGRIVKPSFRARGFHLENISDPIFNDLGMAPCWLQKSLWNKWIETWLL